MLVNTPGESFDASRAIFDTLVRHIRRVDCHVMRACSGGALIACAADHRTMDPAGYWFVHMPWRPDGGPLTQEQRDTIARAKAQLMASRLPVPAARLLKMMSENTTLDARLALDIGIVHECPGMVRRPVVFV